MAHAHVRYASFVKTDSRPGAAVVLDELAGDGVGVVILIHAGVALGQADRFGGDIADAGGIHVDDFAVGFVVDRIDGCAGVVGSYSIWRRHL